VQLKYPSVAAEIARMQGCAAKAASGEADAVLFTTEDSADRWLQTAWDIGVLEGARRRSKSGRLLLVAAGAAAVEILRSAGLDAAAPDDEVPESLARAVLEHFNGGRAPSLKTDVGRVEVRSGGVVVDSSFIPLSRSAAALIDALASAGGRVLTRAQLGTVLPGGAPNPHAVEAAVGRLREALGGAKLVHTVVKRGYRIAATEG
jgi:uroporphyrinogen-III synthase